MAKMLDRAVMTTSAFKVVKLQTMLIIVLTMGLSEVAVAQNDDLRQVAKNIKTVEDLNTFKMLHSPDDNVFLMREMLKKQKWTPEDLLKILSPDVVNPKYKHRHEIENTYLHKIQRMINEEGLETLHISTVEQLLELTRYLGHFTDSFKVELLRQGLHQFPGMSDQIKILEFSDRFWSSPILKEEFFNLHPGPLSSRPARILELKDSFSKINEELGFMERQVTKITTAQEFLALTKRTSQNSTYKVGFVASHLSRFLELSPTISDILTLKQQIPLQPIELERLFLNGLALAKTPNEFLTLLQKEIYFKNNELLRSRFLQHAGDHLIKLKELDLSHPAVAVRVKFLLEKLDQSLQSGFFRNYTSADKLADMLELIQNMKKGGISLTLKFWRARFRESISNMSANDIHLIAEKAKDDPKLEAEILKYGLVGKPSNWYRRCLERLLLN